MVTNPSSTLSLAFPLPRHRAVSAGVRGDVTIAIADGRAKMRRRSRKHRLRAALVGGLAVACCGAAMWLAVATDSPDVSPPVTVPELRTAAWIDINKPFTMFDLSGSDFAKLPLRYSARRDEAGSARQDTLAYGTARHGDPYLRLMFYRTGLEPVPATTLFIDLARLSAEAGLAVTRTGVAAPLATRFGAFEVADLTVAGAGPETACLGFRSVRGPAGASLLISGLACGSAGKKLDRSGLSCVIDRIDLVSAGDDIELQTVFVEAERRRGPGCEPSRTAIQAPNVRSAVVALKGSI